MSKILISYARETQAQAQQADDALRALGHEVWRDDQILAHRMVGDEIEERLAAAQAVLVLWSAEAAKSAWVRSEASRARAMGKLVQCTLDKAPLPIPFDQIQCANLVGWNGEADAPGWRKVVASVVDLVGAAGLPHQDVLTPAAGPIALHGERRYIYVMFTDLAGFSEVTRGLQPEMVASLLNAYLGLLGQTVAEHGGTIDKFVGDAMIAFWGAPVARPDDGERAARAAMAMWRVEEAVDALSIGEHRLLGPTRVGLHRGDAVVAAFGADGRSNYSAMGDAPNIASRLESANKALKTRILASRDAIVPSMAGVFRAMGRVGFGGRTTPVEVFEAALDFPLEARERLNTAYARFDAGDVASLGEISALAAEFPEDAALHALLGRLEAVGPGGAFPLS